MSRPHNTGSGLRGLSSSSSWGGELLRVTRATIPPPLARCVQHPARRPSDRAGSTREILSIDGPRVRVRNPRCHWTDTLGRREPVLLGTPEAESQQSTWTFVPPRPPPATPRHGLADARSFRATRVSSLGRPVRALAIPPFKSRFRRAFCESPHWYRILPSPLASSSSSLLLSHRWLVQRSVPSIVFSVACKASVYIQPPSLHHFKLHSPRTYGFSPTAYAPRSPRRAHRAPWSSCVRAPWSSASPPSTPHFLERQRRGRGATCPAIVGDHSYDTMIRIANAQLLLRPP